jgi:hypothetical protein
MKPEQTLTYQTRVIMCAWSRAGPFASPSGSPSSRVECNAAISCRLCYIFLFLAVIARHSLKAVGPLHHVSVD